MLLTELLENKQMTIYRLSKESGLPYATLNDICNGKAKLEKCSAETVYRIAHALNTSMEDLLAPYIEKRSSFLAVFGERIVVFRIAKDFQTVI